MSKLLKLKDWLTLDDAAKHLSILFGEDATKADILRLALDGRLTLSVNLVNGAMARCGPRVPIKKAKRVELSDAAKTRLISSSPPVDPKAIHGRWITGVPIGSHEVIELEDDLVTLQGIYDLPMIGNERFDVEHEYQMLTGGPAVDLGTDKGAFVTKGTELYCQLQEYVDPRKCEPSVLDKKLETKRRDREGYYIPALSLPADSVLVVRCDALLELHANASAANRRDADLRTRERETLLKLVIGMAMGGYKYSPNDRRSKVPGEIVEDLGALGIGLSDDTVRKWLQEAARTVSPEKQPKA